MATEVTLDDVERYHLLRAMQAGSMAQAIDEFEALPVSTYVYWHLFHWIEAKTEADEIWNSKGYPEAMFQAWGIFEHD